MRLALPRFHLPAILTGFLFWTCVCLGTLTAQTDSVLRAKISEYTAGFGDYDGGSDYFASAYAAAQDSEVLQLTAACFDLVADSTVDHGIAAQIWIGGTSEERVEVCRQMLWGYPSLLGLAGLVDLSDTLRENLTYDSLRTALEYLSARDQSIRAGLMAVIEEYGQSSQEANAIMSLMIDIDQEVLPAVRQIVEEHGWLSQHRVGRKANKAIFYAYQHAPDSVLAAALPMLRASVAAGDTPEIDLAYVLGRVLMHKGEPQVYGTQAFWSQRGESEMWPIRSLDSVEYYRERVGLEPLCENAERLDVECPLEKR